MSGRVLLLAVLATSCAFDPSGGTAGVPGAQPDSGAGASAADAASPDAIVDCADSDGDGAWLSLTGADCGQVIDCDDADPRAFPGQTDYFGTPRTSGGFDFDCDGQESKVNVEQGADCHSDFFDCKGTGWMVAVPQCGAMGVYHECQSGFLSCDESQIVATQQLCR